MISVDTAVQLTDLSRRTLWRRIGDGEIQRGKNDARGRAMIELEAIRQLITVPLEPSDWMVIEKADAGAADAQNDTAMLFLSAGKPRCAVYWLENAAKQDYSDAMQLLATCYMAGTGVAKDEHLGLMWLAKAAAKGHVIAREQIAAILKAIPSKGTDSP